MIEAKERNYLSLLILWSLAFLVTRIPFLYYPYHGEPDIYLMVRDIYINIQNGEGLLGGGLYGKSFSFAYYFIIFKLLSVFPFFIKNIEGLFYIITFISSIFIIFFCLRIHIKYFQLKYNANIFIALFIFSPVFWETSTYSHPIMPALASLLAAIDFLLFTKDKKFDFITLLFHIITLFLFLFSLSLRA